MTGLSIDEVVRRHAAPDYTVYAVGSHAGYCYLGGLDPVLQTPRRKVPLPRLPGGSLSMAGLADRGLGLCRAKRLEHDRQGRCRILRSLAARSGPAGAG
jgi:hypothetical protein